MANFLLFFTGLIMKVAMISKSIDGIGAIQVDASVYGSKWANKTIKGIVKELFFEQLNFYHANFYVEGLGGGIIFFIDNVEDIKIHTLSPWLRKEIKQNENILNTLIDLVKININDGRIFN